MLLAAASYLVWPKNAASRQQQAQLVRFLITPRQDFDIELRDESVLKVGDPIIIYEDNVARIVGNITGIGTQSNPKVNIAWTRQATAEFFANAPVIAEGDYLSYHQTPDSMEWIVQMMLPPHKRAEISELIVQAYGEHHAEITSVLQPIVLQSLKDATEVVREDFNAAVMRREGQIAELRNRYQNEIVERELVPLVKDEIWPIVQDEMNPLATKIGEEIWQHVSVWRFGWRFLYDKSPLPERNLVNKEFSRFMEKHGSNVIESHIPEMLEAQQRVLQRAAENEEVQSVLSDASMRVLRDEEFQKLTIDLLRDVFVDNDRLANVFQAAWQSDQARRALEITNQKLQPTVTKIGQAFFGSPEKSITPEFSRILRNRILHKDNRWLVLQMAKDRKKELGSSNKLQAIPGTTGTENPFHVPARQKF